MKNLLAADESNRALQVIALLMAVALWIFVGLLPRLEADRRKFMVEIKVHNAPVGARMHVTPATTELVLVGPKAMLAKIGDQDLEVFVDARQRLLGLNDMVPLSVSGPPGVRWELTPNEARLLDH